MRSPRYMATTRSASAATLFTLWSTSSTARPSSRKLADQVGEGRGLGARQPGERLVDEHDAADGARSPWRARACAGRRRAGSRAAVEHRGEADALGDRAGLLVDLRDRRSSRSRLSGSSASLMFSSTVWRCSGRECWNTMPTPLRAIRCDGWPAISTPSMRTEPAFGRSMPMTSFITVDLPEPFGPIRPRISPAVHAEAHVLDRDQAAEALGQALDLEERRAGARSRALCPVREQPRKPLGKNRTTSSAMAETMKVASSPVGRSASRHGDQEDRRRSPRRGWCAGRRARPR